MGTAGPVANPEYVIDWTKATAILCVTLIVHVPRIPDRNEEARYEVLAG